MIRIETLTFTWQIGKQLEFNYLTEYRLILVVFHSKAIEVLIEVEVNELFTIRKKNRQHVSIAVDAMGICATICWVKIIII